MAFANWKSKKSQSATATLATVATHKGKTGDYLPSVATVATVAGLEISKQATNDHYENVVVKPVIQKTVSLTRYPPLVKT